MTRKRSLIVYLAGVLCMAAAMGMNESLFNNFLADTFHLSPQARGGLELPRELPGFLVVVMTGVLCMLPITRVGMVGTATLALGLAGLGLLGQSYGWMLAMMILASAGMHLMQPVDATISLALSDKRREGRRLGQVGAVNTVGVVLGTGAVWLLFDKVSPQYSRGFLCAAVLAGLAAMFYTALNIPHLHGRRSRLILRKQYSLYYILEFLFGARKQIFITFGPWVLIRVYGLPAPSIAKLLMIGALIGIVFKPLAGWVIDRFGERTVLVADGLVLSIVCLGYGYAGWVASDPTVARTVASACLIGDNLLFALGSARAIFLSRLTPSHEEINSTLAMGVSINHIVSMLIPMVAGAIWMGFGYERVFLCAAGLAVVIAVTASFIPGRRHELKETDADSVPV